MTFREVGQNHRVVTFAEPFHKLVGKSTENRQIVANAGLRHTELFCDLLIAFDLWPHQAFMELTRDLNDVPRDHMTCMLRFVLDIETIVGGNCGQFSLFSAKNSNCGRYAKSCVGRRLGELIQLFGNYSQTG